MLKFLKTNDNIQKQQILSCSLTNRPKPIGVADYNLIIPKAELEKVVADEMALYKKGYRIQIDKRGNIIKASAAISVAEEAWRAKGIMEGAIGSWF